MQLHSYQQSAKSFLLDRLQTVSGAGLWLDCGLGKTAVTLHAIRDLGIKKTLIIAPLRVIYKVWEQEAKNWNLPFTFSLVHGTPKQREAALAKEADIYLINPDGIAWLEKQDVRYDLLVVDEVTQFKTWSALRSKCLRRLLMRIGKVITLTGTPFPNGLGDIFAQHYLLDRGETLGKTIGRFRDKYMRQGGYENRQWEMDPSKVDSLMEVLKPWYLHQSALDHLDMPEIIHNEIKVEMPPESRIAYKRLAKEMVLEFEDGTFVAALSGGSKYNLCRQLASGGIYDSMRTVLSYHEAKTDALEELVDSLNGKSLLVAYVFKHDLQRILRRFPSCPFIDGSVSGKEGNKALETFIKRDSQILAVQCQAMSHGIDGLQKVCNDVCWYTPTDQQEIRSQLEARVYRQGVKGQVRIHYLLSEGTVDVSIKRVLDRKDATQRDVLKDIRFAISGAERYQDSDLWS